MNVAPTRLAMARDLTAPFRGTGGTPPYTYSVLPGGAGGTVDADGDYTSPAGATGIDVIEAEDSLGATAQATVQVCRPVQLLCDIIQQELGLADGRVFLWNEKINSPTDPGLWVVLSVMSLKPFASKSIVNADTDEEEQYVNVAATVQIDVISADDSAQERKEEVIMAVGSFYSRQQQALNSFRVFPLSQGFVNLSEIDGAAIPKRYSVTVQMQYFEKKTKATVPYENFSLEQPEAEA